MGEEGKKKVKKKKLKEAQSSKSSQAVAAGSSTSKAPAAESAASKGQTPAAKAPVATAKAEAPAAEVKIEPPEDAYRAAAVLFFTRAKSGKVAKVLVALEERKISASFLGLEQKGKISQSLVVFPQGRKEKKDKNDAVETAKREYIEETLDYGGLARYLDFADFEGGGDAAAASIPDDAKVPLTWSGANNMALYFTPAGMTALFCEVPSREVDAAGQDPSAKRRRQEETAAKLKSAVKPSPTYHVGKVGHLQCQWIDAEALREVALSTEKAPALQLQGKECRFFPTNASLLRLPEARAWLGITAPKER